MTRIEERYYQTVDIRRGKEDFQHRVLLKHKQGLGKTVIATRICEEPDGSPHGPVTVICRSHLNIQWQRHLQREYPGAKIGSIVVETPRGRWRELDRQEKVEMLKDPSYDFRVLSFATPRRVKKSASAEKASGARTVREVWRDMAKEHGWVKSRQPKVRAFEYPLPPTRSLIVDEAHHARGRESQQYAGLYQMAVPTQSRRAADRVVLISTTPAWREQDDLFTQLRLLDPKRFRGYWDFVQRYCILDEDEYGSRVVGGRTKRIAKLLQKYAIARDYSDPEVQLAVPDIIPEEVWVGLTDSGTAAYTRKENELKAERANGYAVGNGITEYALITANDPNKLKALDDVIEELDGEPYALFCHWQETLELLGRHTGLSIYSGKSGGSRFTRADKIKAGGSFVGTIGSINEGVDLSHLRTMLFYESDYTYGAMDQVRTRLKRWRQDGSTDPIRCVTIGAPGTVDEISYERSMQRGATDDEVMAEIHALAQKGRK